MAPHPSLAYCERSPNNYDLDSVYYFINLTLLDLTGSLDGSVVMWEFGTTKPVSIQRQPGMGGSVTKIRFTPQGNKVL